MHSVKVFSLLWIISHSVHMVFVDSSVYFNSTNLDVFVPSASSTTDTDSILPSCLAFSQVLNSKPFDGWIEHTKTLPSVITQAGVTLLLVSQSYSLLWRSAKCHSPEKCVEMNSERVSWVGFVGTGMDFILNIKKRVDENNT